MPFGYLITTGIVLVATLLAIRPARRPRWAAVLSWSLTMVLNELPIAVVALFLLPSTLLALVEGDLRGPGGWIGAGMALLATLGLAVVVRRCLRSRPAVDRALASSAAGPAHGTAAAPRRRLLLLLLPLPVRRREVERVSGLRYGDHEANVLDLYRHRDRPDGAPVFIHLHGGRFRWGGRSREGRALLHRLAADGWLGISADYRLSRDPAAGFPDHLVDVKRVLAWVRTHGSALGADGETVFVAGSSAGAHLAAMAALTTNDPAYQPGFEEADTSVSGGVGLYGYYGHLGGDPQVASSPLQHDPRAAPPMFIVHGDHDTYTPVDGARRLVHHLRKGSAQPVVYAELPGAQHAFDRFRSLRFDDVIEATVAFTAGVRSLSGSRTRPSPCP